MHVRVAVLCVVTSSFVPAFALAAGGNEPPADRDTASTRSEAAQTPAAEPVREAATAIVLGAELDGRFWIQTDEGLAVADFFKASGRTLALGLEPGRYVVVCAHEPSRLEARIELKTGEREVLEWARFHAEPPDAPRPEPPARRGGTFMDGRTRIELFGGFADSYVEVEHRGSRVEIDGGQAGLAISHWLREDLALELRMLATDLDVVEFDDPFDTTETSGTMGVLFGARYYFPAPTFGGTFRPYASAAIGTFSDYHSFSDDDRTEVRHGKTRFGSHLGGGVDVQLNRLFSFDVKLGVILREGHDASFGTTFGVGFAWGRGRRLH